MQRILLGLPLLALSACGQNHTPKVAYANTVTESGPPKNRIIRATGTIQAVRSYTVQAPQISGQSGSMTLVKLIPNGARVKEGDVLAELDRTQVLDSARDLKAKFEDLNHQIEQKRAQNRSEAAKRTAELREAEADLAKAGIQLRKGPILSEIERLKAEVRSAGASERVSSLKRSHALREKAESAALRVLELQRDRQKVGLERAERNLERMLVKAPIPGMVALENIWRAGSMGPPQEGDQIYAGRSLLRIFDPSAMVVNSLVNQADGAQLKPGDRAKVALDAYPGTSFDAELEFVSPVASAMLDTPIKSFPARFKLLQTDSRLLPDLSAAVDVEQPR
jgi:multidrug resistance efflux pump